MQTFCQLSLWWNIDYIKRQISPHFFYYPAEMMFNKGFNVEILTKLYNSRNEKNFEKYNSFKIMRFPRYPLKFNLSLFKYLIKKDYSLIHSHTIGSTEDYVPWLTSKLKDTPMVFSLHSASLLYSRNKSSIFTKILRKGMEIRNSENNVFIAFTNFQSKEFEEIGIKNIKIIPHGIDPNVFKVEKNPEIVEKYGLKENNIICVADMRPTKGQLLLVKSMPKILENLPDTKLFLIGRANNINAKQYRDLLFSKIDKMGLKNNIKILNAIHPFEVSKKELIQLYLLSDVFAFPTFTELAPLVSLEAMASKTPMVASNLPYIREILQNGNAGILTDRTQNEFEDKIIKLLDDSNLRNKLIKNGLTAINNEYNLDKVKSQYCELYSNLINMKS